MTRRRQLRVGLIASLLLLDGVLLGALAQRQLAGGKATADQARTDKARRAATDLRIAGVFEALEREGLAASLDALERAAAEDSVVLRDGHQLAHRLGRLAVARSGGEAAVVSQCRPVLASGCYHGVVEAFVQARGRVEMLELQRMCGRAGDADRPGPVYECIHGLGHGVLGAVGDLDAALRYCDALQSGFDAWCQSGVFMEGIRSELEASRHNLADRAHLPGMEHGRHGGHRPSVVRQLALDPSDPFSPCDRFDSRYGSACWIFQGFIILQADGFDAAEALRICDRAPREAVALCYESIGHQLTGLFQRDDAWIAQQCARGRPDHAPHCAAGAARALVQMDWSGARAVRFCAGSPAAWKRVCYATMGRMLDALASPAQRTALCGRVEPAYAELCQGAPASERVN